MELLQLKYFKTVAECGKLKVAAEQLFVSSPALSASISRLEKDLGMPLFERSNNRIVLNEQGRIFLSYVNHIFYNLEIAKTEMSQSLLNQHINIPLAVSTSNLWMEMLATYGLEQPDVTISEAVLRLTHLKEVDLLNQYAFLLADKEDQRQQDLESEMLFVDRPYAMVPKAHPYASQESLSLKELVHENLLLPLPGQSLDRRIRGMFADANLPIQLASAYSSETCGYMVARGLGIAFTTRYAPHDDPRIRYVPLREACCWEQRMYWHKNRRMTPDELAFKDFVLRYCRKRRSELG